MSSRELFGLGSDHPRAELREWESWAKDVLIFKLVRSEKDLTNPDTDFQAVYTHQLFDDEKIRGYRGLRVEVYFAAGDLYTYLHISYDQRHDTQFDDIAELLSSKMAAGSITKNLKVFKDHLKKQVEFRPMGDLVATYTLPDLSRDDGTGESINYDIYKSNFATPGLKDFHERLQFFLLLYIEASSYIDSGDSIWQLLLVFERRQPLRASSSKASSPTLTWGPNSDAATLSAVKAATALKDTRFFIAGYTTLYKFFHFPSAYRLRLSQILILPPFQRRGHGKYLLLQVYAEAAQDPSYTEVNIEDPSPGFQQMRDSVDMQLCLDHNFFQINGSSKRKKSKPSTYDLPSTFDPKSEFVQAIRTTLKLTEKQICRCYEIFKLACLDREDPEACRQYRLEIKARLNHENREELAVCNYDINERKRRLQEMYDSAEEEYQKLIDKFL